MANKYYDASELSGANIPGAQGAAMGMDLLKLGMSWQESKERNALAAQELHERTEYRRTLASAQKVANLDKQIEAAPDEMKLPLYRQLLGELNIPTDGINWDNYTVAAMDADWQKVRKVARPALIAAGQGKMSATDANETALNATMGFKAKYGRMGQARVDDFMAVSKMGQDYDIDRARIAASNAATGVAAGNLDLARKKAAGDEVGLMGDKYDPLEVKEWDNQIDSAIGNLREMQQGGADTPVEMVGPGVLDILTQIDNSKAMTPTEKNSLKRKMIGGVESVLGRKALADMQAGEPGWMAFMPNLKESATLYSQDQYRKGSAGRSGAKSRVVEEATSNAEQITSKLWDDMGDTFADEEFTTEFPMGMPLEMRSLYQEAVTLENLAKRGARDELAERRKNMGADYTDRLMDAYGNSGGDPRKFAMAVKENMSPLDMMAAKEETSASGRVAEESATGAFDSNLQKYFSGSGGEGSSANPRMGSLELTASGIERLKSYGAQNLDPVWVMEQMRVARGEAEAHMRAAGLTPTWDDDDINDLFKVVAARSKGR